MDRGGVKEVQVSMVKETWERHTAQIYRKGDGILAGASHQIGKQLPGIRKTQGNVIPQAPLSGEVYDDRSSFVS